MDNLTLQDLLDSGCNKDSPVVIKFLKLHQNRELKEALAKQDLEKIKLLINNGCDISDDTAEKILVSSLTKGDLELIKILQTKGYDMKKYYHLFYIASVNGHFEIIKFLVENDVDSKYSSCLALRWACYYGYLEIVKFLVNKGDDFKIYDNECIRDACDKGHLEVVKFLIEKGADIHVLNECGLSVAVRGGHLEIVKLLIENGANIHDKNNLITTANEKGHSEISNLLKSYMYPKYFGIESSTKLDIKLPELEEVSRNNMYYYVYKYQSCGNGWQIANWVTKYQMLSNLGYGEPKHFEL